MFHAFSLTMEVTENNFLYKKIFDVELFSSVNKQQISQLWFGYIGHERHWIVLSIIKIKQK